MSIKVDPSIHKNANDSRVLLPKCGCRCVWSVNVIIAGHRSDVKILPGVITDTISLNQDAFFVNPWEHFQRRERWNWSNSTWFIPYTHLCINNAVLLITCVWCSIANMTLHFLIQIGTLFDDETRIVQLTHFSVNCSRISQTTTLSYVIQTVLRTLPRAIRLD